MKARLNIACAFILMLTGLGGGETGKSRAPVTLQRGGIIPTNSPAFREYALSVLLSNANLVAERWQLDVQLPITTNQITGSFIDPTTNGLEGSIQIDNDAHKYGFKVSDGRFNSFGDTKYRSQTFVYSPDEQKDKWPGMTNLLTLESAVAMAKDKLHRLGIDEKKLGMGEPFKAAQWRYDSNDVFYPLPLYAVQWKTQTGDYMVIRMEISGVTSNVAYFSHNIPANLLPSFLRVPTPTNYLQLLGLPSNTVFRPHDWDRRQKILREAQPDPPIF